MVQKRALLVGINYPGTKAELKGCANDVARMRRALADRFGFDGADIAVLLDTDESCPPPTGRNIRRALARLVHGARPGDVLFFHYSGHGTRLPAEAGEEDDTGYDECIVPCDFNLITDHDFRDLVANVPDGCTFTMVADCCHSGGLLDKAKEQIGNSTIEHRHTAGHSFTSFLHHQHHHNHDDELRHRQWEWEHHGGEGRIKNRSLPLPALVEVLRERSGKDNVEVGSIRMTLFHLFGDDASKKIQSFMTEMLGKFNSGQHHHHHHRWRIGSLAHELLHQHSKSGGAAGGEKLRPPRPAPVNGVLVSGCQTDQTSADACLPEGAYGALSNAIQVIIAGDGEAAVANGELVSKVREKLRREGYQQQPGLYCNDEHLWSPFICDLTN